VEKQKTISGFSKLSKRGKIKWLVENFFKDPENVMRELMSYWHSNEEQQKVLDGFSENTISNFPMPFGVAPNFVIDGKAFVIPMVTEESSVVAAASNAAKFWMSRGGFQTNIISTKKLGQVHFYWKGEREILFDCFQELKTKMIDDVQSVISNMEKRGGGISEIKLLDLSDQESDLFQIFASFETCDSMGANFINSCLESFAKTMKNYVDQHEEMNNEHLDIIMSILSNYTPECLVRAKVECPVEELGAFPNGMSAEDFASKFERAVRIAKIDPYRATTHNKGIFNGIDAVVIATGNDFRAIEACGHAYASRSGRYSSLSDCKVENGIFSFWLEMPLAIGTVGGLTNLHPMAKRSLEMLEKPSANDLMKVIASAGLAQNFAAIKSLVTTGIQKGHMKMHLQNILVQLKATDEESKQVKSFFLKKEITHSAVVKHLESIRSASV